MIIIRWVKKGALLTYAPSLPQYILHTDMDMQAWDKASLQQQSRSMWNMII